MGWLRMASKVKPKRGHSELRKALLASTRWTRQRMSQLVQRKQGLLPMTTRVAQAIIAHERGIRLGKYLEGEDLREVQEIVTQLQSVRGAAAGGADGRPSRGGGQKPREPHRVIVFPSQFRLTGPLLPATKLNEAREMAQIYPLLYLIENSLREVIRRVMEANFGEDWWGKALTSGKAKQMKVTADQRMAKEEVQAWHQRRGAHPVDYVDLDDLRVIAVSKPQLFFPNLLGEQLWFEQFMRELYPSRCVVCHMNPLSKDNVQDVRLKAKKWRSLLTAAAKRLPPG